jgi:hypothetical protein
MADFLPIKAKVILTLERRCEKQNMNPQASMNMKRGL